MDKRWTWLFGTAATMLAVSVSLLASASDSPPSWLLWAVAAIVLVYVAAAVAFFCESWNGEFCRRFDEPVSQLCWGLNQAYGDWKLSQFRPGVPEPPATCVDLAAQCQTWVMDYSDAAKGRPEAQLLAFATYVYPARTEIRVGLDCHKARESMKDYLKKAAKVARWPTPFRWWIRHRIRQDLNREAAVRLLLCLELALGNSLTGAKHISDSLARVPALFRSD